MGVVAGRPVGAMGAGVRATAELGRSRDPLSAVLDEGERSSWFYAAAVVAFMLHTLMVGSAAAGDLLKDLRLLVQDNRTKVHDFFWRQYDVELPKDKPKEEKPPEPPPPDPDPAPPPPPAPKAVAPKEKDDDPYKNLPPTPAKAAAALTRKEDPDEPKDLTGNTLVTGDGSAPGGQVSAAGTGSAPVMSPHASLQGTPGGKGSGPAPSAAPAEDRSRPPGLEGGNSWRCPFPPEAEAEDINQAVVTLAVTVRPDGSAISATVTSDPGHGFGRAARICALARRYTAGLDRSGHPTTMTTPVRVTFSR